MNRGVTWFLPLVACSLTVSAQVSVSPASFIPGVGYTLIEGSDFVDDCLICGRPTILQPLFGSFNLVPVQNTPPYTRYAVRNLDFFTGPGWAGVTHITGGGTYTRFEEFAMVQNMDLDVWVQDAFTNRLAYFTNNTSAVDQPFPLIQISLSQTNGTLLQTFSMDLVAVPVREIWFSTTHPLQFTNNSGATNTASPGDLISNRGRIVKRNADLVQRLGVMPMVPDLGLDAVQVTHHGEILFSITQNVWSETLGAIQHGDLLSSRGVIVKRNQALLAAFGLPAALPDRGLDAVQVMPSGEILFSIQSNVVVNAALRLSSGDILSDSGHVFRTNKQLLAKFQPTDTNADFGLDALQILPSGEIWFSVERGFTDARLGPVLEGDLLSDRGYRVLSNRGLVAAFQPVDPSVDYGLDGLFVVTDLKPCATPPHIVKSVRTPAGVHLEWDGDGDVFQLERASDLSGPWLPCGPIDPDAAADASSDPGSAGAAFYRVRQW